jgi:small-conductance mechanosensitive channel
MESLLPALSPDLRERLVSTVILLVGLAVLRVVALRIIRARAEEPTDRYRWRRSVDYLLIPLGLLLVARVWWSGVAQLGTFLGLVTAGIALALREPIANIAGWAFLLWRRPFRVGDRVEVGTFAGDVIDMRLFQFSLLEIRGRLDADQPTGRIVHVPNATVFTTPQANFSDGFPFIWVELPVPLTFDSNWQRAKPVFRDIAARHACSGAEVRGTVRGQYAVGTLDADPVVFTSVAPQGVLLTIRALCPVRAPRAVSQAIWEDVLRAVSGWPDVSFAYPTTRLYDQQAEGRVGAGPPPVEGRL